MPHINVSLFCRKKETFRHLLFVVIRQKSIMLCIREKQKMAGRKQAFSPTIFCFHSARGEVDPFITGFLFQTKEERLPVTSA